VNESKQASDLQELLAAGGRRKRLAWLRRLLLLIVILALAAFAYRTWVGEEKASAPRYQTEQVTRGELVVRVSATGNLQPTNQVDVGSELSGIVEAVLVDDNDRVKKGEVLARLDRSKLRDAVARSQANLAVAEAKVLLAQATQAEARANLTRLQKVAELSGGKVPSQSELDSARASLKRAEADVASAHAGVDQAQAALQSDRTNLDKAEIRSPIDGVVLAREVEPGQTVAASFQAPVLFTLAEDLTKMELQVDVDEADVGQVQPGQQASFSVDAWPGRQYSATITRVSYGAQETEGVVSYQTVLAVGNDDLSLRPGMTGTADIVTLTRDSVLLVPNAALRYTPPAQGETQQKSSRGVMGMLLPRPPHRTSKSQPSGKSDSSRVWVLREGKPFAVEVKTGASDGRVTEIVGGELAAGMAVITEDIGTQP